MASVYLVLKLEGINLQYCTGFENACVCRGGSCEKLYFSLKDSEVGGVSEIKIQKKQKTKKKHTHTKKNRAFRNKANWK